MTGQRFGRLVVLRLAVSPARPAHWVCVCDCGTEKTVMGTNLRGTNTRSCGCLLTESRRSNMLHNRAGVTEADQRARTGRGAGAYARAALFETESQKAQRGVRVRMPSENPGGLRWRGIAEASLDLATCLGLAPHPVGRGRIHNGFGS